MSIEWIQVLTIIASVIGSAYYFSREIKADIKCQTDRLDASNARIDQLYNMFVDLLKSEKRL